MFIGGIAVKVIERERQILSIMKKKKLSEVILHLLTEE